MQTKHKSYIFVLVIISVIGGMFFLAKYCPNCCKNHFCKTSKNNNNQGLENMNQKISQIRAKHILCKTKEDAIKILKEINENKYSFEDAAKKYSSCPSANNGGDLGFFARNIMVKPFEEAAFNTKLGAISEPVQTEFGWHLIKVEEQK